MIRIKAPDGSFVDFPDGTADSVIIDTMRREFGGAAQPNDLSAQGGNLYSPQNAGLFTDPAAGNAANPVDPVQSDPFAGSGVNSALAGLQGYTYGGSDELLSRAVATAFPNRTEQPLLRQEMQAGIDQFRADEPLAAYSSEIMGTMLNPATWVGGGAESLGARILQNGVIGGLLSGFYGFNAGEGDSGERLRGAVPSAEIGAGISAAIPVVGSVIQRGVNGLLASRAVKTAARNAPSMDDLRTMAGALYAQADASAPMPRTGLAPIAQRIADDPANINLDSMLVPEAARVANNLTEAATSPNPTIGYRELDILRRQAAVPAGDIANPTQSAIGTRMIDGIDEFIAQSDPNLSQTVVAARDMWARLRRSEVIEQAIERARNQASGFENGIRTQFRAILNNPKRLRGFSTEEVNAIRAVVRGTPMGNVMRTIGKLGIDMQSNTNALGATIGMLTGGTVGSALGPAGTAVGAVALPAFASLMRAGANRTTQAAANRVQGLLTSGGVSNVPRLTNATIGALEQAVQRPTVPISGLLGPYLRDALVGPQ